MRKYRIDATIKLSEGDLILTDSQARRRRYVLKEKGKGLYEILSDVYFKAGEVIQYAGEIGKAYKGFVEELHDDIQETIDARPKKRGRPRKSA